MKTACLFLLAAATAFAGAAPETQAREVRASARTHVNGHQGGASINRNANLNRNVNRNVNVNRNINVDHHVDIDVDVDRHYHPWATAAAVTTAAVVTGAVIGSMVRSIPPSCGNVVVNGITYSNCGGTWYMPQMQGGSVVYVVVAPPA